MSVRETIRQRIRQELKAQHRTMRWLANHTGLGKGSIYRKNYTPQVATLCKIADGLGVSIDWLCGRSDTKDA